jgi:hypothetical protein
MKKIILIIVMVVIVGAGIGGYFVFKKSNGSFFDFSSDKHNKTKLAPFGTSFIIHLEVGNFPGEQHEPYFNGGSTRAFKWEEFFWESFKEFVKMADSYDAKLTIEMNPQWVEFFKADEDRLKTVMDWYKNGHELALQHHGADHIDWNGFTNRTNKKNDPRYRGNIQDMLKIMSSLGIPMKTMTLSEHKQDYPAFQKFFPYEINGRTAEDGGRRPYKIVGLCPGLEFIQLGMAYAPGIDTGGAFAKIKEYFKKSDEKIIYNFVTHEYDIWKATQAAGSMKKTQYKEWFDFTKEQGYKIRTIGDLMDEYQKIFTIETSNDPLLHNSDYPNDTEHEKCGPSK